MIITKIKLGEQIAIGYVKNEDTFAEHCQMKCKERFRPEFKAAMLKASEELQHVSPIPADKAMMGIKQIDIKYDDAWHVVSFNMAGMICGEKMFYMKFAMQEIIPQTYEQLTKAVILCCEEAVKYVGGNRAQGSLFQDDESADEVKALDEPQAS